MTKAKYRWMRSALWAAGSGLSASLAYGQVNLQVTSTADDGSTGTLRWAFNQANFYEDANIQINTSGTIKLSSPLPVITFEGSITGVAGTTISGNNLYRPFFIDLETETPAETLTISNLSIENGMAHGGIGGIGNDGGGGGLGAGGAIFVNTGAVTLSNVLTGSNSAIGGNGGSYSGSVHFFGGGGGGGLGGNGGNGGGGSDLAGAGGGGGGLYGNGGAGGTQGVSYDFGGGGGGGGEFYSGAYGTSGPGGGGGGSLSAGSPPSGDSGGAGGNGGGGQGGDDDSQTTSTNHNGHAGTTGGGGGGSGTSSKFTLVAENGGTGGKFGGGGGAWDGNAGAGGDFGGGGASGAEPTSVGGAGGFGAGGGGGDGSGGAGGFGGGAGGGGGGNNSTGFGGSGGSAYGGAIFVRSNNGASITIADSDIDDATLTAGTGGANASGTAGNGQAAGSSVFLPSGTSTFSASSTEYIFGSIADDAADGIVGGINKTGNGTLILTGNNTYTGGTTISAGTLQIGNFNNTGAIVGNVTDNGTLIFLRSDDISFGGVVSGSGVLKLESATTLTLTGANSYSGGTAITQGTIDVVGHALPGGNISISSTATLQYDTSSATVFQPGATITGAGTIKKVGGNSLAFGSLGTVNINLSVGALVDVEGGTVNGSSSYQANWSSNLASLNIASGATFDTVEGGSTQTEQFDALTGAGTFQGGWSGNTNATTAVTFGVNNGGGTFSGAIKDDSNAHLAITKTGSGTEIFAGNCTYTGGTTISAGTLQIGNAGSTGSITGNITDNASLIFNRTGSVTYAGNITGSGSFKQAGSGTTILTGANSYSGSTMISAGTLQIGNDSTTGSIPGNVTDSGTIAFDHSDNITFGGNVSGTGSLTQDGPGTLSLTGTNTYSGGTTLNAGTLGLGIDNAVGTGAVTINGGNIRAGGAARTLTNAVNINGSFTIGRLTTLNGTNTLYNNATIFLDNPDGAANALSTLGNLGQSGGTYSLTVANGPLFGVGTGALAISGNATYTGGTTISSGALQIGTGSSSGSVMGNITDNASLILDRSDNPTFSNTISGSGSLSNIGSGTIVLTGSNTYSGGTTISAGTLQIGSGGTTGNINGNITNNGALIFDRSSANYESAGNISGSGTVSQIGSGNLILLGTDTYLGTTTISSGSLTVGTGSTGGSLTSNIVNNTTNPVTFNRVNSSTYPGVLSGTGGLTKSGAGTLTLTNVENYSGNTIINAGTLQLGAPVAAPSGYTEYYSFDNVSGSTVLNDGSAGSTYNATLSGMAAITSSGLHGNGLSFPSATAVLKPNSSIPVQVSGGLHVATESAWFYGLNVPNLTSVLFGSASGDAEAILQNSSGDILGNIANGGTHSTSVDLSSDATGWHMLTVVENEGSFNTVFYLDGQPISTISNDFSYNSLTAFGNISAGGEPFAQKIDEVYVYNQALTAAQVQQLYAVQPGAALPSSTNVQLTTTGATLDLNGNNQSIASLTGVAGTNVLLGSGSLTVGSGNLATVFSGTVSGPGSLTKVGSASLTLGSSGNYSGGTSVTAGTIIANNASALGTGGLSLSAIATVQFAPAAKGTAQLNSLSITTGGILDLGKTDLLINYTSSNPYSSILLAMKSAYDTGKWDLAGIRSSSLITGTSLGIYDNSINTKSAFDNIPVDSTTIAIKYTWYGDANLDGVVNTSDLAAISITGTTWQTGDFNYDGKVNADDYSLFMLGDAESGGANISTILPEPSATFAAAIGMACMGIRRRRFNHES